MRKSNQILDELVHKTALTAEGKNWLVSAIDPFHDEDITIDGYPDLMSSSTVVQLVKKSIQLAVPKSVTTGANWDCSISLWPLMVTQQGIVTGNLNSSSMSVPSNPNSFGGLAVAAGAQGGNLWPGATTPADATMQPVGMDASEYCKGNFRVIGMAFEVLNTTADINKQGQVTVWRLPTVAQSSFGMFQAATAGNYTTSHATYFRCPPANLAAAQLLFGSRSWPAREGAYVVSRQNSANNPCTTASVDCWAFSPQDQSANTTTQVPLYTPLPFYGLNGNFADAPQPFDISGCHFTGLSYATTLTVNVRWLIERVPSPAESDLVVLATPSAPYDPIALDLFCQAMSRAPPGVMLKENPMGEWFRAACDAIARWAPFVASGLSTMGVPGAVTVGNLVQKGARYLGNPLPSSASHMTPYMPKTVRYTPSTTTVVVRKTKPKKEVPKKKEKKPQTST